MGEVYLATDTRLDRRVAIKKLRLDDDSPRHRQRFEREARAVSQLSHPHICALYDVGDEQGQPFLVMEYVEGETLARRLRRGPLPWHEVLRYAIEIVDALDHAHGAGVVHRDLKPSNIMLTRSGVKLLDFGLAQWRLEPDAAAPRGAFTETLTEDGAIVGTVQYMAPEQLEAKPADARSDIFAFGAVVYEMATGRPAFDGASKANVIAAVLGSDPEPMSRARGEAGGADPRAALLEEVVARCLARRPGERWQTARDLRHALACIAESRLPAAVPPASRLARSRRVRVTWLAGALAAGAIAVLALTPLPDLLRRAFTPSPRARTAAAFTQITNFTDSAVAPALSPDGRMVAFIRGDLPFLSTDPIYVKMLPDGEAIRLTADPRPKYGLAFSADGSKLAYTTLTNEGWNTQTISVLGGEPALFLRNAAGLTWLDRDRLLFAEIKSGFHMGIVTATQNRDARRELYFPDHERAMAHYAYPSPDRRWALVVQMDHRAAWEQCRLVSLDASSPARRAGPPGGCVSAGWSRDGTWMYFAAEIDDQTHLWRQRFPDGQPEQLTFGPTQESGIAVAPDDSVITSIGTVRTAIWIHDARGERPLTSEGDVVRQRGTYRLASFSRDGRQITYLRREAPGLAPELWRTDITSGTSEALLPGVGMVDFDISPDGASVVFTAQPRGRPSELWIAPLDRSSPPRRIASSGENSPYFAPYGEIHFRFSDGQFNYLGRMDPDGSGRRKVVEFPISTIQTVSADRRWAATIVPRPDGGQGVVVMAIPTAGGSPRLICDVCWTAWSSDGRFLYLSDAPSEMIATRTFVLPISRETGLPDLPETGIQRPPRLRKGWRVQHTPANFIPGIDRDTHAFLKTTVHRNLFRIPS
jgi:Tol biopolymer transport system component